MTQSGGDTWKWLKYGCFGCLGILGLFALLVATVSGLAWNKASNEEVASQESAHDLPVVERVSADATGAPGTVVIHVEAQAEIEIEAGPEGEPLRVEASYDTRSFELHESLEVEEGDDSWTYRLRFAGTGSSWLGGLSRLFGGSQPRLRIQLPADAPMTLDLKMARGGAEARLGGLSLISAEIDVRQGGMLIEFDEPMRRPMDRLSIRAAMGGFSMEQIGNASPRKLDIDCSMGGGFIDLQGAWTVDSEIDISASMGGAALQLPRNVHVVGVERPRFRPVREPETPLPTLTFSITTGTGGDVDVIE